MPDLGPVQPAAGNLEQRLAERAAELRQAVDALARQIVEHAMAEFVDDGAICGEHGVGVHGARQPIGIVFGCVLCIEHLRDIEHQLAQETHALVARVAENLAQCFVEPAKAALLHLVQGETLLAQRRERLCAQWPADILLLEIARLVAQLENNFVHQPRIAVRPTAEKGDLLRGQPRQSVLQKLLQPVEPVDVAHCDREGGRAPLRRVGGEAVAERRKRAARRVLRLQIPVLLPVRGDDHERPAVAPGAGEEPTDEFERACVDPVCVVENQDQRQAAQVDGRWFEHAAQEIVETVDLRLQRCHLTLFDTELLPTLHVTLFAPELDDFD